MFRSVRFYRLNTPWPDSEQALSEQLASAAFKPCGPYAERSSGWEPPSGDADGSFARRVEGADLLRLRTQTRLLPTAAINEALEDRLEAYRERMQEEPGRREKRKLKEQTRDELLPKALLKSERTGGFVIPAQRLIAIGTLSVTRAERFLEQLRAALPGLDVTPLGFERPVGDLLTRIFLNDGASGFALGGECRMCDPADSRATVRCADMDLTDAAVRKHVTDGMHLTHLGIEFNNLLACTIDQTGGIAKLTLAGIDADVEELDKDPLARLDADFALLSGALRQLISAMKQALGGYDEAAPDLPLAVGA
jgi:recombination associated protein RdgC